MNFITAIFGAIGSVFNWITGKQDLNNTPDMKDRKKAQQEINEDNRDVLAIKNKDEKHISNVLSR